MKNTETDWHMDELELCICNVRLELYKSINSNFQHSNPTLSRPKSRTSVAN